MARGEVAHQGRGQRRRFLVILVRPAVLRRRRWMSCKGGSTEGVAWLFGGGERWGGRKSLAQWWPVLFKGGGGMDHWGGRCPVRVALHTVGGGGGMASTGGWCPGQWRSDAEGST
jgi:hypothetical protein